jgi:hypothetical protein
MRSTLLSLIAKRDALVAQGVPLHELQELNMLVQRLIELLRARRELCSCHPDCLDECLSPESDDD